ncbi:MAG: hypothetical protein ACM3VT_20645 [Solirubrobacterales bacterium]
MNGSQTPYVSVINPITPAIERARMILFRPFDLGKWCVIGFGAWLAQLGETGGGGGGGGGGDGFSRNVNREDVRREVEGVWRYVIANLDWIVPTAIAAAAVLVGLWLLVLWLSSRGRFIFLHCVAQNRAEVIEPWHQFRNRANSLFAFRAILGVITIVAAVLPFILGGIVVSVSTVALGFNPWTIIGFVAAFTFFFAALVVSAVIGKFTKDFVVPIMYLHTNSAVAAWKILLDVLSFNKARFFLYILMQVAIAMAIGMMVFMAACCTCCCLACLFALPYVGTVILLPVHVFNRSYSLYYLAQYGPQFNVFPPQPDVRVIPNA